MNSSSIPSLPHFPGAQNSSRGPNSQDSQSGRLLSRHSSLSALHRTVSGGGSDMGSRHSSRPTSGRELHPQGFSHLHAWPAHGGNSASSAGSMGSSREAGGNGGQQGAGGRAWNKDRLQLNERGSGGESVGPSSPKSALQNVVSYDDIPDMPWQEGEESWADAAEVSVFTCENGNMCVCMNACSTGECEGLLDGTTLQAATHKRLLLMTHTHACTCPHTQNDEVVDPAYQGLTLDHYMSRLVTSPASAAAVSGALCVYVCLRSEMDGCVGMTIFASCHMPQQAWAFVLMHSRTHK